ncbi:sialic acid-binding Ig-like lectin 14 [Gambusia affinis]|uniref:sialic acid-binding Ig-like lectin 14 n=1 Tax=Gambusia affinis TaxID=33528 RepID=UPI001CDB6866|nr:sialic acid-binding Ig-like lectin 14 [Gambusia affinis]
MMDLKLWLSILMVCGMAESLIWGKDWLINVPSRIPVLHSSCVVVPCVYMYPKTNKVLNRWRGFWKRGDTIVASNFLNLRLTDEFHKRSRITGTLQTGNCTWQLYGIRETDTGPFYLRIEIPQHKSYSFVQNKVTLNIFRVPKPPVMSIEISNTVTATCKVTHVCPVSPPTFSWSHNGRRKTQSKKLNYWLWSTTSTLTFTPQETDYNMPLNCTVRFPGGKTTEGSVVLR